MDIFYRYLPVPFFINILLYTIYHVNHDRVPFFKSYALRSKSNNTFNNSICLLQRYTQHKTLYFIVMYAHRIYRSSEHCRFLIIIYKVKTNPNYTTVVQHRIIITKNIKYIWKQ